MSPGGKKIDPNRGSIFFFCFSVFCFSFSGVVMSVPENSTTEEGLTPPSSSTVKRKKCEGQENIAPQGSMKKKVRTSSSSLPPDLLLKKSILGLLIQDGSHRFDRSCIDYAPEIIHGEREKERQVHIDGRYLSKASEITHQHRLNVLNQIASIHLVEESSAETVFLATSIFDRYLSQNPSLPRQQAMTLSFASFFIACKYDQFPIPLNFHLKQFSVSLGELLEMEKKILKALDWDLSVPTPLNFLREYSKLEVTNDNSLYLLAKYVLELSHREYSMMKFYPSTIAASVIMVCNKMLFREPWPTNLSEFTGYEDSDLIPCANAIVAILCKESGTYRTLGLPSNPSTKKYSREAFAGVVPFALSPRDWLAF